jgi:signal transduction histidine kinase
MHRRRSARRRNHRKRVLQKKIVLSLVLLVLLPVGLLGWLGTRMAKNEQQMVELQVQTLRDAQLKSVDDALQSVFQTDQTNLLEHATVLKHDVDSLRAYARNSPQVRQVMVLGADGKRVFPPTNQPLTMEEKQFVERSKAIWENPALLSHSSALGATLKPAAKNASVAPLSSPSRDTEQHPHGWYVWHWNAELHHIFWWRDPAGRLIGFELSPVRVLSDIMARLPATGAEDNLGDAHIRLFNANGQVAYQWGKYQPEEREASRAMLPLSHPLGSWKLEYYAPTLAVGAAANRFGMLAAILALTLALAGLAFYLYREQAREMRVAEQRVNFVNQVSHELKTPLTNIRMYAELLETELTDDDWQDSRPRKYLAIINAESQRLSRLIANVLSFARAAKEHLVLHPQPAVADDIIARCIEAFAPALLAKSIEVRLQADAGQLVLVDTEVLEQILNNLISNVEKYAASGARMDIASTQQGALTTICVRDFGPGIAKREQQRVFQPFYRISSKLTDGVAGTGIGLSIARELARLHGGDLALVAVPEGACFRLTLLAQPAGDFA